MHKIPIFIMTRNEGVYLEECLTSIIKNTSHPFHIYLIDNNSTDKKHIDILHFFENCKNITVIYNKTNRWVLGLNEHLESVRENYKSEFFVMSDGDIKFPEPKNDQCWLTTLISDMKRFSCIGKIGMSLNWDLIKEDDFFTEVFEQEKKLYDVNKKIDHLFISPVDTTVAIYRWDWSIAGYKFYPDHIRYLRPELYSCRTARDFNAEHLGWNSYKKTSSNDIKKLEEKILCFSFIGADLKKTQLELVSRKIRLLNKLIARPMKYIWSAKRIILTIKYTLLKGIRSYDNH